MLSSKHNWAIGSKSADIEKGYECVCVCARAHACVRACVRVNISNY